MRMPGTHLTVDQQHACDVLERITRAWGWCRRYAGNEPAATRLLSTAGVARSVPHYPHQAELLGQLARQLSDGLSPGTDAHRRAQLCNQLAQAVQRGASSVAGFGVLMNQARETAATMEREQLRQAPIGAGEPETYADD